ncbi:MAG TPA: DUF6241 domain-containing protein [Clostridiaceae bacterium]
MKEYLIAGLVIFIAGITVLVGIFIFARSIKGDTIDRQAIFQGMAINSEMDIYNIMHTMANSKIVAADGKVSKILEINSTECTELKVIINELNYKDKEYLLKVLNTWGKNDFSLAVDEHNYLWGKLGGTIGKAIALKQ